MDDTPEDHAAIQPVLSLIQIYPLSQFDGKIKTKDWSKVTKVQIKGIRAEYSATLPPWVEPAKFFDQLATVMKQVPQMPGEEVLFNWLGRMIGGAAKDSEVMNTLGAKRKNRTGCQHPLGSYKSGSAPIGPTKQSSMAPETADGELFSIA